MQFDAGNKAVLQTHPEDRAEVVTIVRFVRLLDDGHEVYEIKTADGMFVEFSTWSLTPVVN